MSKEKADNDWTKHIVQCKPVVHYGKRGYEAVMDDNKIYTVYFDGTKSEDTVKGRYNRIFPLPARPAGINPADGHLRITPSYPKQVSVNLERFVMVVHTLYTKGELPQNYSSLVVNCMNSCGNINNTLGVEYDISPEHLEWCLPEEHGKHQPAVDKLRDITGDVYEISAKDTILIDLINQGDKTILNYLNFMGIQKIA